MLGLIVFLIIVLVALTHGAQRPTKRWVFFDWGGTLGKPSRRRDLIGGDSSAIDWQIVDYAKSLSGQYNLGILSNGRKFSSGAMDAALVRHGLGGLFKKRLWLGFTPSSLMKPDARLCNVLPAGTVALVGNTATDAAQAAACGFRYVDVNTVRAVMNRTKKRITRAHNTQFKGSHLRF